jgi:16S rRNA (guanine(966)-N(2))-methyltransferase RsmD
MSLKIESFKKIRKDKKKWKVETPEEFEEREDTFLKKRLLGKEPTINTFVRITGGKAKNYRIDIPKTTRPLTDRMKVRIFDILREDVVGKKVLDLYAGAGSFALEALSRGASEATVVDASKNAEFVLKRNVAYTGFLPQVDIIKAKAEEYLFKQINDEDRQSFDIVFMDPPYKLYNTKNLFKMERVINMAAQMLNGVKDPHTGDFKGTLIVKHPRRYPLEKLTLTGIKVLETVEIGLNSITFFIVDNTLQKQS